jgi:drug/metabolite transporter (DMT)-like permease
VNFLPVAGALAAAFLFGASTPAAKTLAGELHPMLLAGLLYAGSGLGLSVWMLLRGRWPRLSLGEWSWLAGAIASSFS